MRERIKRNKQTKESWFYYLKQASRIFENKKKTLACLTRAASDAQQQQQLHTPKPPAAVNKPANLLKCLGIVNSAVRQQVQKIEARDDVTTQEIEYDAYRLTGRTYIEHGQSGRVCHG